MMKAVYPIVLTKDGRYYIVDVPDFGISTYGKSMYDAIKMARDAIGIAGIDRENHGEKIPEATSFEKIVKKTTEGIVTLVDVDFVDYRKKHERRAVKKTLSLPSWLNETAGEKGINYSAVLQAALKKELGISEKEIEKEYKQ